MRAEPCAAMSPAVLSSSPVLMPRSGRRADRAALVVHAPGHDADHLAQHALGGRVAGGQRVAVVQARSRQVSVVGLQQAALVVDGALVVMVRLPPATVPSRLTRLAASMRALPPRRWCRRCCPARRRAWIASPEDVSLPPGLRSLAAEVSRRHAARRGDVDIVAWSASPAGHRRAARAHGDSAAVHAVADSVMFLPARLVPACCSVPAVSVRLPGWLSLPSASTPATKRPALFSRPGVRASAAARQHRAGVGQRCSCVEVGPSAGEGDARVAARRLRPTPAPRRIAAGHRW